MVITNRPDTGEKMSELEDKAVDFFFLNIQTEIESKKRLEKLFTTSVTYRAETRALCMYNWNPKGGYRRNHTSEVSISDQLQIHRHREFNKPK